jgi:hypothetical protein
MRRAEATRRSTTLPVRGFKPTVTGDYCSIAEVQEYLTDLDLEDVSDEPEIQKLINRAMDHIERFCRNKFRSTPLTERYDGSGQQKLILRHWPIISVTSVKIYNYNNQLVRTAAEADLILDKEIGTIALPPISYWLSPRWPSSAFSWPYLSTSGYFLRGSEFDYYNTFGKGISNIEVVYTYGHETTPESIKDACIKLVVIDLLRKKGVAVAQGTTATTLAGVSETYQPSPYENLIRQLQEDIKRDLAGYVSRPVGVV